MQHLVITLLSEDKPGVVQQVAQIIAAANGSWHESRMSQLAGKFAGILKISIADDKVDSLSQQLTELSAKGIQVLIDHSQEAPTSAQGTTLAFELIGGDSVGIISEIANAFAEANINIEELETHCSSTPWSGEPLFEATGILIAPDTINREQLLERLEKIEDKLGVDIAITEQL